MLLPHVYESLAQNGVSINSVNESLAAMSEKINSTDTYVRGIWDSVEGQKSAIAAIVTGSSPSDVSDDVKMAIMDVSSSVEEVRTGMRNLKAAQDESKNTLKTSLDSAIYGLKQDNREIVEFMQRMNTNIVSATNDPDKARREEEAKIRDEELKRSLDERFKAQEDFVHKESVKVYRNVQAVINEKTDRQTDGIDSIIKKNTAQMNQVKVIAIIAAALSGIDIVLQVLKMFGVI